METIAIVGTGIAGMGCGHFLKDRYSLTFYEQNEYVGGHTHTVLIREPDEDVRVDTGFIVFNKITYPNLCRLFQELQAPIRPTSMSFSVQHTPSGLEYCGSGFGGLFAQRRNLVNPRFLWMLGQIHRFNTQCVEVLEDERWSHCSVQEYTRQRGLGRDFLEKYLIPMSSAVWSSSAKTMADFPIRTLVRFFDNHGFLGLHTQHPWYTVVNGSWTYRDLLTTPFAKRIFCKRGVRRVFRDGNKAVVEDVFGTRESYDKVVLAAHADQALQMLDRPTESEKSLLTQFRYERNSAILHTDDSVMPATRRAWSSWNYRIQPAGDGTNVASTVYYMNSLQDVSKKRHYFVSINDPGNVDPDKVITSQYYEHPVFSIAATEAQKKLHLLNESGPLYFCGSYFRYGFHEDAFTSALELCRHILGERIWS